MGIMDMFNRVAGNAPQTTTPNPAATAAAAATPPAASPLPEPATGPSSPLENYKDVWQAPKVPEGSTPVNTDYAPKLPVDHNQLLAAAKQVDYIKTVDPALLAKATSGDVQALLEVINHVGQTAYAQSAAASAKISESSLAEMEKNLRKQLPGEMQNNFTKQQVRTDNPLFTNPAAAPILNALTDQLMRKNPGISADALKEQLAGYMDGLAGEWVKGSGRVIQDAPQQEITSGGVEATDWEKYLT